MRLDLTAKIDSRLKLEQLLQERAIQCQHCSYQYAVPDWLDTGTRCPKCGKNEPSASQQAEVWAEVARLPMSGRPATLAIFFNYNPKTWAVIDVDKITIIDKKYHQRSDLDSQEIQQTFAGCPEVRQSVNNKLNSLKTNSLRAK